MNSLVKCLVGGAFAFAGGATVTFLQSGPSLSAQAPPTSQALPASTPTALALGDRFETIIRRVSPAVVSIEAVKPPAANSGKTKSSEESGSGVLVRFEGVTGILAITNNHVIAGANAEQITIHLSDNRILKPTRIWADPESDIAALLLDANDLTTVTLGDSDRARVGQWVLAFGSPFGLSQTVTHGIISARDRGQVSLGSTIRIKDFLQTDAAINPGSSGGALVNMEGEVVGINTAIASNNGSNSGVAFSIPANMVRRIVKQLVETGSVSRGYLGVHLAQAMEPADAVKLGLERVQGALVESVYPESPAQLAGLQGNDVILQVDGVVIRNENHLINLISALPPGQKVRLRVWRDRRTSEIQALVGDWNRIQARIRSTP